jgi:hypothetical protein
MALINQDIRFFLGLSELLAHLKSSHANSRVMPSNDALLPNKIALPTLVVGKKPNGKS